MTGKRSIQDALFMRRCFELARMGAAHVSPNPQVGSVIVRGGRIIGEGYHHYRGGPHAEVEAVRSVSPQNRPFLKSSTIYVSLEPCCHFGKTPPCTQMIVNEGIPRVVISTLDPNPKVAGKGIEQLEAAGIEVVGGVLEKEGKDIIRAFSTYMREKRPHVILKFVKSTDGFMGLPDRQVWLSNSYESTLVHKLRSEVDGIMVGTETAIIDNPRLTNRYPSGKQPLRVVFDRQGRIPPHFNLLDGSTPTLVLTSENNHKRLEGVEYRSINFDDNGLNECLAILYQLEIQTLLVEGGASLLRSFLEKRLWDEAWVVTTEQQMGFGIPAPQVQGHIIQRYALAGDHLVILRPGEA